MSRSSTIVVLGREGLRGTIEPGERPKPGGSGRVSIRLDDGRLVVVPDHALTLEADGTYRLALGPSDLAVGDSGAAGKAVGAAVGTRVAEAVAGEAAVIPVVREEVDVSKRVVETGRVRVSKVVREREEVVDIPLLREQVEVERVAVNRLVEGPVESRQDGDTLVIPLLEEVLVVEKRLMLKEELRITRRQVQESHPQRVTLRTEEAVVNRTDAEARQVQ